MSRAADAIVVGLGAMGSAALRALARRGARVVGFDAHRPPHALGSSHGRSRIIREAYFEDPAYVPLVQRAWALWEELERERGERLLVPTGGLMIGPESCVLVRGALASATRHGLPHEVLDATTLAVRFAAVAPDPEMVAVWEPRAGVLSPEAGIGALLASAGASGATIRAEEPVVRWRPAGAGFEVETARDTYRAERLVLCAGPWLGTLVPELSTVLAVERVVQLWFEPTAPERFTPERCPISIWEYGPGRFFYSFPALGHGVKAALHHQGRRADPDQVERRVGDDESHAVRRLLERYLPGAAGRLLDASVCLYTNTPDEHFLIDRHPQHSNVLVVSACSGHGFKFAPAIGEIAAELTLDGRTAHDLGLFGRNRLEAQPPPAAIM